MDIFFSGRANIFMASFLVSLTCTVEILLSFYWSGDFAPLLVADQQYLA